MSAPYRAVAAALHARGWAPIPLPPGEKWPPPEGYTGRTGAEPDLDRVLAWAQEHEAGNVALRLPRGVVGIDVDGYADKRGGETLAALEAECGPLPPTWVSTSRTDGVSGIRLYRVPEDYESLGEAGPGIEVVQHHHRYVACAPSTHPEGRAYRWVGPDGADAPLPPPPHELPELPERWRSRLAAPGGPREKADLGDEAARELLGVWLTEGQPDERVGRAVQKAAAALFSGGSRHDAARGAVAALVRYGAQGRPGVRAALETIRRAFAAATEGRDPGEWARLVRGAVELVAADDAANAPIPGGADAGASFIDWTAFWAKDRTGPEWVVPDVLARGRGHSIYARHGTGKSEFVLWTALEAVRAGHVVVYLDYEQGEDDLEERLGDMGVGPETDLSLLRYALLPSIPPLNRVDGAAALCALVDGAQAEHPERHVVVVIDTISRAIEGEENANDTIQAFYRHTGLALKQRGVTWVRVDHSGWDGSHARGASAKGDDVDVVWRLERTDAGMKLTADKRRMSWVAETVFFRRVEEPELRYERATNAWPLGTLELAAELDELRVPLGASTREAQKALRERGTKGRRRAVVVAALRHRRMAAEGPEPGREPPPEPPLRDEAGTTPGTAPQKPHSQAAEPLPEPPGTTPAGHLGTTAVPYMGTAGPSPDPDVLFGASDGGAPEAPPAVPERPRYGAEPGDAP